MSVLNPAILYEPERGKATVDIVFVHGLGGDALKTWTRESCCWPRDLLKDDFPDARIMTWGYDSSVAKLQEPSSQTSIFDHAESLLNSVSRARDGLNKKERPIIFVCHSLGGLVTKQALIRASEYLHNNQDHRLGAIFTYTTGVIFMGTPHRGSDKTPLGHIAAAVAKVMLRQPSRKLLKILEKDSDILEHQRRSFDSIKEQLFIVCLRESLPMKHIGMIVPEWSSTIDGFKVKREAIPKKDHRDMVQFSSKTEEGYRIVSGYLQTCVKKYLEGHENTMTGPLDSEKAGQCGHAEFTAGQINILHFLSDSTSAYEHDLIDTDPPIPGTCEWLLRNRQYQEWRGLEKSCVLWVTAGPGNGKTTLAKFLIGRFSKEMQLDSNLFCYFFFRDDNHKQRTAVSAVCALLHQAFGQKPDLISHAVHAWQLRGQSVLEDFWGLWGILIAVMEDPQCPQLACVIDALDECEEESRRTFIRALASLDNHQSAVKFIVTSRPYGSIEDQLQGSSVLRLQVEDSGCEVSRDIELVVRTKLSKLAKIGRLNSYQQDKIQEALLGKAEQTFLWISLILAEFETSKVFQGKDREYLELLSNPPPNLDSVYERILRRTTNPKFARKILHIVVAAARPLTLGEMNVALSIEPSHKSFEELKQDLFPERGLEKLIGDSCGLFVGFEGTGSRRKVKLVHQTAREFLIKRPHQSRFGQDARGLLAWFIYSIWHAATAYMTSFLGLWKGSLDPVESNRIVARACMSYLLLESFANWSKFGYLNPMMATRHFTEYTFLYYSAKQWVGHFRQGEFQQGSPSFDLVLRLCATESIRFSLWPSSFREHLDELRYKPEMTSVMVASYLGLESVVKHLLSTGHDIAATDDHGRTALIIAAMKGRQNVVRLLLRLGADINTKDAEDKTAVHWAARYGHDDVMRLLIETQGQAHINDRTESGWTALHYATDNNHETVVRLLLQYGADANAKDSLGWAPFHLAAFNGNEVVMDSLLEQVPDIDSTVEGNQTALHAASAHGHVVLVRALIYHHATIDVAKDDGRTALHVAASYGDEKVLRVLLSGGARIDIQDKEGRTALYLAVRNGCQSTVQLLLANGADIEIRDHHGRTALHRAAMYGCNAITRALLDHGANVHAIDNEGASALLEAIIRHNEEAVAMLLKHKSDVSARDKNGRTAMHLAATKGRIRGVRLLLEHGASDIDTEDNYGRTPLQNATWEGYIGGGYADLVKLLLENNANPSTRDINGRTPLHGAASNGLGSIVVSLLEYRADVGAKDCDGETALHVAVRKGHEAIAKLLLGNGSDISCKDKHGKTAIDLAQGNDNMLQLLEEYNKPI